MENTPKEHAVGAALGGTLRIFIGEAILLPTGLVTAAYLTRRLGTSDYGLLTLVSAFVAWVEWSVSAVFSRATLKFVGEADDWRPLGGTIVRLHFVAGAACAAAIVVLAGPLSRLFGEPSIAGDLRLLALQVPVFCVAQAMRNILVAIGRYRARAWATGGRSVVRMLAMTGLAALGFGVRGAVIGLMIASLVELAIVWLALRPPLFTRAGTPAAFGAYLAPLFLAAMSTRLVERLDLMALKALGGTAADAGYYGAAQNLAIAPGLFGLAFAPIVLATLSRLQSRDEVERARSFARLSMRLGLVLLPLAAVGASVAPALVTLIFGNAFLPAAPLFALLVYGALAFLVATVATTMVTAAGRPGLALALTGPMLPLAVVGHLIAIPRWESIGAAAVTTSIFGGAAVSGLWIAARIWRTEPPFASATRSVLACLAVHAAGGLWPVDGAMVVAKIAVLTALAVVSLVLLGELDGSERVIVRRWAVSRLAGGT